MRYRERTDGCHEREIERREQQHKRDTEMIDGLYKIEIETKERTSMREREERTYMQERDREVILST